jgi:gluconolactonase
MSLAKDFTLALSDLKFVGENLSRPESVIACRDGTLFCSDKRGGVTRIAPDGKQVLVGTVTGVPNGISIDRHHNIFIANIREGLIQKIRPDGTHEVVLSEIDGHPLGAANSVFVDGKGRFWISVSTRSNWFVATASPRPDGYIILMDEKGPRVVADGILFTNEIRLDSSEEYLYAAESMAARMLRFRVQPDGMLSDREVFGPDGLGYAAFVDGFALDGEGNVWVTTVTRNGLVVITADGEAHTVFEDPKPEALDNYMARFRDGTATPQDSLACMGATLQFPTSVAFGGPDLKTVYLGSLVMPHLVSFRSPVAGAALPHWRE